MTLLLAEQNTPDLETVRLLDGRVDLWVGDVMTALKAMAPDSVDCVVTSPPYWGLRDYGVDGQIGLEPSLGAHLDVLVEVFEEVRRVLKPEGTLWLNYGDCYASTPNGKSAAATKAEGRDNRTFRDKPFSTVGPVYDPSGGANHGGYLKPKDLCMVPARLAIALQAAGWWVRSEIIWAKPNPMPESVRDRPANAVEKIYLLTKSERYFFDMDAVRQGRSGDEDANCFRGGAYVGGEPSKRKAVGNKKVPAGWAQGEGSHYTCAHNQRAKDRAVPPCNDGYGNHTSLDQTGRGNGRNLRNYEPPPPRSAVPDVWEMATRPFPEAHFATFPVELAERCIKAGCPEGGLVLDIFGGAGTTALAALAHRRRAILIELNPAYAAMAETRLKKAFMGPDERKRFAAVPDPHPGPLFSHCDTTGDRSC